MSPKRSRHRERRRTYGTGLAAQTDSTATGRTRDDSRERVGARSGNPAEEPARRDRELGPTGRTRPHTIAEPELSASERHARAKRLSTAASPKFEAFRSGFDFELDDFQIEAAIALEAGNGVLVAAPTGAGKTIVGEFAIYLALATGRKAFYTTPIKALSNQKYHDLVARYGPEAVGLLTGDTSINGNAQIVVMTTEVLRNMLYAGSGAVKDLGYVVMDEVHYLADRFRGSVWEEVIIHLDQSVQLVSLSATVSNAEEFGDWLTVVRGATSIVVSERRPVPLWQYVMTAGRGDSPGGLLDLYAHNVDPTAPGTNPPINPDLLQHMRRADSANVRGGFSGRGGRQGRGYQGRGGQHGRGGAQHNGRRGPPRFVVLKELRNAHLLPAIYFIFSRAACDDAVHQCRAAGLNLTTPEQAEQIRIIAETRCASIPPEDLAVLGYWSWLEGLTQGIAAHHAGMLPLFKETVEELFSRGLIKVVFATETLALGINMPARTVVLEKLVKWDGTGHVDITPGQYTQLTGRAGRRGIDVEGHAVVVDHPGLDPVALAGLASKRLFPLKSSFMPSYNMAVNLVDQVGKERAKEILETSFAQFQADRGVVNLAQMAAKNSVAMDGYREAMACSRGDFGEYLRLRSALSAREKELSRQGSASKRAEVMTALGRVRAGDVLEMPTGRSAGYGVVIEAGVDVDFHGPRPTILTEQGKVKTISTAELPHGFTTLGYLKIKPGFAARNPGDRKTLTHHLRDALRTGDGMRPASHGRPGTTSEVFSDGHSRRRGDEDPQIVDLRFALRAHPCHGCPDRENHTRWGERLVKLKREHQTLVRKIDGRTGSIGKVFDRVCAVLLELDYLAKDEHGTVVVTPAGRGLKRLYAENDLLLAQCLATSVWADLNGAQLAAAVSTLLYSSRRDEGPMINIPGGDGSKLALALDETVRIWSHLTDLEAHHRLDETQDLDFGLVNPMHKWVGGRSLDSVLHGTELTAGDFVRWCKQVLDVLDQITQSAEPRLAVTAEAAIKALKRGVVAYSSV